MIQNREEKEEISKERVDKMMKDKMRHHVWVDGQVKCRQGWEKKKSQENDGKK